MTMSLGHCWQVVTQLPLEQSASFPQVAPVPHLGQGPPQSMSLSPWFLTRSLQRGGWQIRVVHTLLVQSLDIMQPLPSGQGSQAGPPQSLPVSDPFWIPSVHVAAAQTMFESQMALAQSRGRRQRLPGAHGAHDGPPQSTSVSPGLSERSSQDTDWHFPPTHGC
jgi:hypothetical protein